MKILVHLVFFNIFHCFSTWFFKLLCCTDGGAKLRFPSVYYYVIIIMVFSRLSYTVAKTVILNLEACVQAVRGVTGF